MTIQNRDITAGQERSQNVTVPNKWTMIKDEPYYIQDECIRCLYQTKLVEFDYDKPEEMYQQHQKHKEENTSGVMSKK